MLWDTANNGNNQSYFYFHFFRCNYFLCFTKDFFRFLSRWFCSCQSLPVPWAITAKVLGSIYNKNTTHTKNHGSCIPFLHEFTPNALIFSHITALENINFAILVKNQNTGNRHKTKREVWLPVRSRLTVVINVAFVFCRVLYGNKITEISKGLFEGLFSLQLLWVETHRRAQNQSHLHLIDIQRKSAYLKHCHQSWGIMTESRLHWLAPFETLVRER